METLFQMRRSVTIVHHVPGRIRLRATPSLGQHLMSQKGQGVLNTLKAAAGIKDLQINPLTASVVVQYDPQIIPSVTWENLFQGDEEQAQEGLRALMKAVTPLV